MPAMSREIQIDITDLSTAVLRQKNGKAPGFDGLRPEVVKRSFSRINTMFLDIVRTVFDTGIFPEPYSDADLGRSQLYKNINEGMSSRLDPGPTIMEYSVRESS